MPDLTREQILAMPAGPEMDRRIAERVMGLEPDERGLVKTQREWLVSILGEPVRVDTATSWIPPKRYSSDPRAMLEVIENRRAAGWYPAIEVIADEWECIWYSPSRDARATARAETMPLAVARAALLTTLDDAP